jgi:hypothetical protein
MRAGRAGRGIGLVREGSGSLFERTGHEATSSLRLCAGTRLWVREWVCGRFGSKHGGCNALDLEIPTVFPANRCPHVCRTARSNPSPGPLQAHRARVVAGSQPEALDVSDLRTRPLPVIGVPMEENPKQTPPLPKCPRHRVFMQYHSGEFPRRFVFCPECNDYWKECGENYDHQILIYPAFTMKDHWDD